ncbi:hypothetical protein [Limosilactobacillus equigenerosi]|uniref:Uncharacterized protein n=1 Tax=Limosilactobacillus equigenerosi DSM 18793 = JCM 14505 TaxID=1423742 RepID=A0A0R1UIU7_9LACO|nr:hypothetical protein [Limosilactobacillus equigenerosi]KRL93260.1 hypothetical protein FC21_GL000014 [Limosilactobacillus equigenerosi DSM 18793 = JCM 14505]
MNVEQVLEFFESIWNEETNYEAVKLNEKIESAIKDLVNQTADDVLNTLDEVDIQTVNCKAENLNDPNFGKLEFVIYYNGEDVLSVIESQKMKELFIWAEKRLNGIEYTLEDFED